MVRLTHVLSHVVHPQPPGVEWDGARPLLGAEPNEALEATGHSVRSVPSGHLYGVARASAWALGHQNSGNLSSDEREERIMAEMEVPMSPQCPEHWSRRAFVCALTLAGTAGLLAVRAEPVAAEPPPETTRLAIVQSGVCFAPQYVAESLLRAEGFSDVHYMKKTTTIENYEALASGHAHLGFGYAAALIARIDGGDPVGFVAGGHVGCQQIVGHERIGAIRDLRGKRFAIARLDAPDHIQMIPEKESRRCRKRPRERGRGALRA